MELFYGLLAPFLGSTIGALFVFFTSKVYNKKIESIVNGIASGVMIAASIFSLILPAILMSENSSIIKLLIITFSFSFGFIVLLYISKLIEKYNKYNDLTDKENFLLFLVITLHNIPEGIAVGVVLAAALTSNVNIGILAAISLSIGIAIQNIPETTVVSMKYRSKYGKVKAFLIGVLSGSVEPIAGIITFYFASFFGNILPILLTFAAGAMFFAVMSELNPSVTNGKYKSLGLISFNIGFFIMMALDVSLG